MRKSRGVPKQRKPQRKVAAPGRLAAAKGRLAKGAAPRATRRGSLAKQLLEAQQQQAATADILKVIASSPDDAQPVFDAIAASACRLLASLSASVILFIDGMADLKALTSTTPEADEVLKSAFPRSLADFPPARIAQTGEIMQVPDTEAIDDDLRDVGRARGFRSAVFMPLMNKGAVIGVIGIARVEPGPFAEHHLNLLHTFADQAVIAIENTRLFNETKEALEQQRASSDILRVISSSVADAQPVFDKILVSCKHLFGSDETAVLLLDGEDTVTLGAYVGKQHEAVAASFPAPLEKSPAGRAIRERRVAHYTDAANDPRLTRTVRRVAQLAGYESMAYAPMLSNGRGIGAIGASRNKGSFSDKELTLLQTFADQAVIAIENARLFNETKEALERQTATAEILRVIASSPSDVQPVFEAIAERSNRIVDGRSTAVFSLVDDVLHLMAFTPTSPEADAALRAMFPRPLSRFRWAEAISRGEVYQVPDMQDPSTPPEGRELARRRGFRALMVVPLVSEQKVIGVISVTRVAPGKFADHHVQLLQTFADQAVIAIENVRLFDEVQARTRDLAEALQQQTATGDVLKVIASSPTDMGPALQAICESACKFCDSYDAGVLLKKGDELHFSAHHGPIQTGQQARPISREWVVGRSVVDLIPVHVSDFHAPEAAEFPEGRRQSREQGHRCTLSVPLLRDGEAIGAIALRRLEPVPFSDTQIALLQTFADQAVIAIGNVRLFEEVQAKSRDLSQSLDDLRTAQDRLVQTEKLASLGQLTAGIAHEIKNPLNFVNNFSTLSAELIDELTGLLKDATLTDKMREEVEELAQLLKDNLGKVVQHGKRADSIVKNMLLHSREGSGEQRSAEINALVDESLNLAYHGARAENSGFNITLQRDFDARAGAAELFPQEITRALLNLISNGFYAATKRMSENGGDGFEPVLRATTKDRGSAVEIRIRDNGTGVPPNVREKMFNPFFTTKPAGEGTGLGLSMAHDIIVKQHGGQIDVATEPGQFTEFTIVLPRSGPKQ